MSSESADIKELYKKYSFYVYKIAFNFLQNHEASEDIVQTVFGNILGYVKGKENCNIGISFIKKTTVNSCLNLLKRKKIISFEHVENADEIRDKYPTSYENVLMKEILSKLPKDLKEIAIYFYIFGHKPREIGEVLNKSERSIERKIKKTEEILSDFLK